MAAFYIPTVLLLCFVSSIQLPCVVSKNFVLLGWNDALTSNTVNYDETVYYIEPVKDLYYVLGCIETKVDLSKKDFDIQFHNSLNKIKTRHAVVNIWGIYSVYLLPSQNVVGQVNAAKIPKSVTATLVYLCGTALAINGSVFFIILNPHIFLVVVVLVWFINTVIKPKNADIASFFFIIGCIWVPFPIFNFVLGFAGFIICYHFVVNEPRSHPILQWLLEVYAFHLISTGMQLPEVSLAIIGIVVLSESVFSQTNRVRIKSSYGKLKNISIFKWLLGNFGEPPPRKLLTDEEFHLQGQIETQKALEELRKFCHSPQCSPWKTLLANEKSCRRFAIFLKGEGDISDDELTLYENEMNCSTDSEKEKDFNAGGDASMSKDED